jgi:hypothetical protein
MDDLTSTPPRHRAVYTLEMGVWRATCRICGHSETDPSRRRAASVFRNHIRDVRSAPDGHFARDSEEMESRQLADDDDTQERADLIL